MKCVLEKAISFVLIVVSIFVGSVMNDISHANAWVWSNYQNKGRCNEILKKFSSSWQYTEAHLVGVCRRQDMFDKADTAATTTWACCDVCISQGNSDAVYENF